MHLNWSLSVTISCSKKKKKGIDIKKKYQAWRQLEGTSQNLKFKMKWMRGTLDTNPPSQADLEDEQHFVHWHLNQLKAYIKHQKSD